MYSDNKDIISRQAVLDAIFNDWDGMVVSLPTLIKRIPSTQRTNFCPNCGADMRKTNATKEQREQLDLMRAKAQMNIKPR